MEKTIPHIVFVDDGYPEADEFANNYRERASDVDLDVAASDRVQGRVLARFRRLLGIDSGVEADPRS